jgi:hypothetical protein
MYIGMYANDLAYYDGVVEEQYTQNSPEINILQIVWRMELVDQVYIYGWMDRCMCLDWCSYMYLNIYIVNCMRSRIT